MLQKSRFASTASFGSFARSDPSSSPRRYPLMTSTKMRRKLTRVGGMTLRTVKIFST